MSEDAHGPGQNEKYPNEPEYVEITFPTIEGRISDGNFMVYEDESLSTLSPPMLHALYREARRARASEATLAAELAAIKAAVGDVLKMLERERPLVASAAASLRAALGLDAADAGKGTT